MASLLQLIIQGHTLIKHEAFAPPAALAFRYLLEVLEDVALQVVQFYETLPLQVAAGLLFANSSGAVKFVWPIPATPGNGQCLDQLPP